MGKMIDLTSKLGEINDIEHYISLKSSYFRLYNANHTTLEQVFKYHSYMGHCFSKVVGLWKKKKKEKKKVLLFLIGENRHGIGKNVAIFDRNGAEIQPLEKDRKCPGQV